MSGYRGFLYAFILICITAKGSILNAQDAYLDKLIDYQSWVEGGAAFLQKDDTFYTFSVGFEENNSLYWKIVLSRIDGDSKIVDQRSYFEEDQFSYSITQGNVFFAEDSSSIYAFGYKRDTVSAEYGLDNFIMKLKLNGDT